MYNNLIQLSEALLALKIKGDRRRQKEIKDISFVAETGHKNIGYFQLQHRRTGADYR